MSTTPSKAGERRVNQLYHRRSVIGVHADGSSRGAVDPWDGVEGLTDIDEKVWGSRTLVHGFVCGGVITSGVDQRCQVNESRAILD